MISEYKMSRLGWTPDFDLDESYVVIPCGDLDLFVLWRDDAALGIEAFPLWVTDGPLKAQDYPLTATLAQTPYTFEGFDPSMLSHRPNSPQAPEQIELTLGPVRVRILDEKEYCRVRVTDAENRRLGPDFTLDYGVRAPDDAA